MTVNIRFCKEKQKVGLFVYHLEGLRVPQFGNALPLKLNKNHRSFFCLKTQAFHTIAIYLMEL